PAHALAESFDVGKRCPRNPRVAHIVMLEMRQGAIDMVGLERAADTALALVGAPHEMLDDELAAAVEEIGKRNLSFRRIEDVILLDLDPRQGEPRLVELIAPAREFLLLGKQR